ncbi:hypothetical protein Q7A53_05510 [Halobacillus rhizosphaerae]|uniref:phage lytic cycle repressor MrpR family protein n=1 Tax=Halobacillus rhizosphaerae TaxID=3064889 RepID=UPI00398B202C
MVTATTDDKNNHLFNERDKQTFIDDLIQRGIISDETARSYLRILYVTSPLEEEKNKDLNKFTFSELEEVLRSFQSKNRNTIESYGRIISAYLHWSVKKKLIKVNLLESLKPNDFAKYVINDEIYFTDKQLRRYEDACENYQDNVIIRLLFEGVGGKKLSEIRNLKKTDIDWDNKRLKLTNSLKADEYEVPIKYTERYINVEQRTLDLLEGAIKQSTYAKKNGEANLTEIENIRPFTDLVDNDYVIRASITRNKNKEGNTPVDKYVIYRRIHSISESLGINDLSAKYIQRSGMVHQAHDLLDNEQLVLDDIKIIADRFNVKSHHNLKSFLTVEKVRATYPKKEG